MSPNDLKILHFSIHQASMLFSDCYSRDKYALPVLSPDAISAVSNVPRPEPANLFTDA